MRLTEFIKVSGYRLIEFLSYTICGIEFYRNYSRFYWRNKAEISDEEIMDSAYKYAEVYPCPSEGRMCKHDVVSAWNKAIEWYKEQLKQRQ